MNRRYVLAPQAALEMSHQKRMRTTLSLDDDVLQEVRAYAQSRDIAFGKAVSVLLRRGLHAPLQTHVVNGFHVVDLPPGSPPVSSGEVKELATGPTHVAAK